MEPNHGKLDFSRSMTDLEGSFITSDICHNYGIMSGCDEGCPALLDGDCEEYKEALKKCDISDEERKKIIKLYT